MIETDIVIIGAGPCGLFSVFEAGLLKLKCHILDSLAQPGGQCIELYPKKPIYDIPGYPEIIAGDLIKKLLEQIKPFNPGYTLGETALTLERNSEGSFIVTTDKGTKHQTKIIAIATIAGGGDSALDWTLFLSDIAKKVILIHRRNEFRGADESVSNVQDLKNEGKIEVLTPAQVISLKGSSKLDSVIIDIDGKSKEIIIDYFIPLFGLVPKLGPIKDWGLEIENNAILVNNSLDYQTNIKGIYAIGDVNTYPGKLNLILSGFHEAAVMCHSAYNLLNPGKKNTLKYTTISGVEGFDGSKKEAKRINISKIN